MVAYFLLAAFLYKVMVLDPKMTCKDVSETQNFAETVIKRF